MGEVTSCITGSSGVTGAGLGLVGGRLGGGEGEEATGGVGSEACLEMDIPGGSLLRGVG